MSTPKLPTPATPPPPSNPAVDGTTMGAADTAMLYTLPKYTTTTNVQRGGRQEQKTVSHAAGETQEVAAGAKPVLPKGYNGAKVTGIQLFSSNVPQENTQLSPSVGNERSGIAPVTGMQQLTHAPSLGLPTLK